MDPTLHTLLLQTSDFAVVPLYVVSPPPYNVLLAHTICTKLVGFLEISGNLFLLTIRYL